ncbi:MAG: response regulator [Planctomycetota bacterium]|nr:MAG: response regulator [Planctomycetota bacterium]
MKVLVVDDNSVTVDMLEHTLRRGGYDVLTATSGRAALEIVERGDCQLVVTDWEMPEMSGLELCRRIRQFGSLHYVYVILLTARRDASDTIEGMTAGADDFIAKPFQPTELILRVRAGERLLALETRDLLIFLLAKLTESRDNDAGAHLERVRTYSRIIAEHLRRLPEYRDVLSPEFVRLIYLTSPLHDIGKVAIPDAVLLKPGSLTEDEFEVMKTHTTRGAETLDAALKAYPTARFLRMARDIAISHHEWYDGSGYPRGLAGSNIPLCGRIVALADTYDALTSKRVYKEAYSHEKAKAAILKSRGSHFDPDVVDAFLANEKKFIETRQALSDASAQDTVLTA